MIGGEEFFAVIAIIRPSIFEQTEDDFVRMRCRSVPHFFKQGRVDIKGVVFKGGTGDLDGSLVFLVRDRIAKFLHILEGTLTRPFRELRELPKPAVSVGTGSGRYKRGDAIPLRRGRRFRVFKNLAVAYFKRGKQRIGGEGHQLNSLAFAARKSVSEIPAAFAAYFSSSVSAAVCGAPAGGVPPVWVDVRAATGTAEAM